MILTNCAACAAPLAHNAPRCVRCKLRYCNATCQHDHWRRGHKQMCKKIHRGGNAEQYHADKKYKEAVAVAVEACADDTKGQTCYICTEAVHSRTGEGLVRGCACGDRDGVASGTTGIAHVSCLAEQAKISVAEAELNNLDWDAFNRRWRWWSDCSLCEQRYHGYVACALGWACWKTYVGRPETDQLRSAAMTQLANGLAAVDLHTDALAVEEAVLSLERRCGGSEPSILSVQSNLAVTYRRLGRLEEAHRTERDVYSGWVRLHGEDHELTLQAAGNYATSLSELQRFEEARSLMRKSIPVARRALGESNEITLKMRWTYADTLHEDPGATLDELREAVTTLEDTASTARRVLGGAHPLTASFEESLRDARAALRARETPPTDAREDGDLDEVEDA
ncbi:unnamed protein product [Pelagomonas calceolata]|uniref:MYND-type domain-containing protein n=1 Tax=Pelagomonas calceolata TaxID=35677 RepID=A0A8J2T1S2_9STRA|nr:unnamed protein product [Pelagomonas calceolata]